MSHSAYRSLLESHNEINLLKSSASLLQWDQETAMPPGGAAHRAEQSALLARLIHERVTQPQHGEWLADCQAALDDFDDDQRANLHYWQREWTRSTRIPEGLAVALSRAASRGQNAWLKARKSGDFADFAPALTTTIELKREEAAAIGWPDDGEPWDALADEYDPGMRAASVAPLFDALQPRLQTLIARYGSQPQPPELLTRPLPLDRQRSFVRETLGQLGFDFERGILAESSHPFCTTIARDDVRMTTRYRENGLMESLLAGIHESGHALYELGLPARFEGQPRGAACGLSIHESQSRLLENHLGRSEAFWQWLAPRLKQHFALDDFAPRHAFRSANRVQPSLIRVEADEATYNLHIMLRFRLERALIAHDLQVDELPQAWNDGCEEFLGIRPANDNEGCLQDIHWPLGAFGYFPTYTLGTLYAAQFWQAAERALPDLATQIAKGEFAPLVEWLRREIHERGQLYSAADLCRIVTGESLGPDAFIDHLERKLSPLFGLD